MTSLKVKQKNINMQDVKSCVYTPPSNRCQDLNKIEKITTKVKQHRDEVNRRKYESKNIVCNFIGAKNGQDHCYKIYQYQYFSKVLIIETCI